jgi:hypothetical protein
MECLLQVLSACWRLASYHTQFQEVVISSIPISYFNGRIEWNSNGMVMEGERHGMCESVFKTAGEEQGNGMGTAWYV